MGNSEKNKREQAIRDVAAKIVQYNIAGSEIAMYLTPTTIIKVPSKPVNAKYQSLTGDVWSGRGRKPSWVIEYEMSGGNLSDCAVISGSKII